MMSKTTVKKDAPAELALKMVATLEELRRQGPAPYPPTVERLAQESDPRAPPDILRKAIKKTKEFLDKVVVVRRDDLLSPVALADDEPAFVESPQVMEFLLRRARTPTNHVMSIAQLKLKARKSLQKSFSEAANRLLDENRLPPGIAWIFVNRARKLFFLEDVRQGVQSSGHGLRHPGDRDGVSRAGGSPAFPGTSDFAIEFDSAFEKLNRREGSMNFVSLVDLRQELSSYPRPVFDAELRKLWSEGRYSLRAAEGRFGISPEEREAGFLQEGTLLLFVSRNTQ
jgi:hypothetical protein